VTKVLWGTFEQLFDDYGYVLNGGSISTYAGGTTTPKATYTDSTGGSAHTNPIILSASGRKTGGIWVNKGEAYKFVLEDSSGNLIDTLDNVVIGESASSSTSQLEVALSYSGTPGAQAVMGIYQAVRTATFPVDFDGASASVGTNPASDYVVSIQKDGVEIGTVTFDTSGTPTFATTGGATQSIAFDSRVTFVAPASVGTAADFGITLVADL